MATAQLSDTRMSDKPVYNGPIFDADTHIHEKDFSFLQRYLPTEYHEKWMVDRKAGPSGFGLYLGDWKSEVHEVNELGTIAPPGQLKAWLRAIEGGNELEARHVPTPDMFERDARVRKLDEFGVDGSIMFVGELTGVMGLIGDEVLREGPEGANALFHAWNLYLVNEWGLNVSDRIYPTALLSLWDLDWAVAEAKWLVENGVRVVLLPMGPVDGMAPADPYFDPLWAVLNEAGVVVTFHVSEANFMHPMVEAWGEKPLQSRRIGQSAWQWMFTYSEIPVMMTMASFVFWNFFERFPNIKMASVENGAEWLPRFLYKMDKMRGMARNGWWPMGQLKERPSRIFKRHCFVVAYPEDNIAKIVEEIGDATCLLMGSDYPHAEGVPAPIDFVAEGCRGLTEKQIYQVMYENGRRLLPPGRTGLRQD